MKKVQRSEYDLGEIFPESGQISVPISNLFEEYIRLFDEPGKAVHSEATEEDNKIDNLKKITDEAAKEIKNDPPKPTGGQSSTDSPNIGSFFKGGVHQHQRQLKYLLRGRIEFRPQLIKVKARGNI